MPSAARKQRTEPWAMDSSCELAAPPTRPSWPHRPTRARPDRRMRTSATTPTSTSAGSRSSPTTPDWPSSKARPLDVPAPTPGRRHLRAQPELRASDLPLHRRVHPRRRRAGSRRHVRLPRRRGLQHPPTRVTVRIQPTDVLTHHRRECISRRRSEVVHGAESCRLAAGHQATTSHGEDGIDRGHRHRPRGRGRTRADPPARVTSMAPPTG